MSDTLIVRDHSQPCKHGELTNHWIRMTTEDCPGGREIVLRRPKSDGLAGATRGRVWVEVEHE